jgi:hypothetical protein
MTPADEAEFIALRQWGASYRELAAALRCPLGTVASRSAALVAQGKIQPRPWGAPIPADAPRPGRRGHPHPRDHQAMDGPLVATPDRGGEGSGNDRGEGTEPSRRGTLMESPDRPVTIDAVTAPVTREVLKDVVNLVFHEFFERRQYLPEEKP